MLANSLEIDAAAVEDAAQVHLYNKRDITLVRGAGMELWDAGGNRYLDMMSNYGVAILGHSHSAVTEAIRLQAGTLISAHQGFYNDTRARFLQTIDRLLPDGLRRCSFSNSGAEAVEAALKFARLATGRGAFVATKRGYHGRTFGALSVTGEPKYRAPFAPLMECTHVGYGDLDAMREAVAGAAAIILEPIQGESGVRIASAEYLQGLRRLCDEAGTLLIFDEVQTAFRTGRTWCWEHSGVQPDIMTLSKPLANGLPIGLTVVADRVAEAIGPGTHGTTFGGNPLICAAGIATLEVAGRPEFNAHVTAVGDHFLSRLRAIDHPGIREVRGRGLMVAVELKSTASPVLQRMQARGVLAINAGKTAVRFLPPLIAEAEHVDEAARVFAESLSE
jgi:acetylornithine/LysW-gamma-L-lysine aminotransferase